MYETQIKSNHQSLKSFYIRSFFLTNDFAETTAFFFLVAPGIYTLEWVEGKVWNASSRQPLAFVNIIFPQSGGGVSTDIDSSFRFRLTPRRKIMVCSYLGYEREAKTNGS